MGTRRANADFEHVKGADALGEALHKTISCPLKNALELLVETWLGDHRTATTRYFVSLYAIPA
jgi:hypothetical protein